MNTARIVSIAAIAAFASLGAQAAQNAGDVYGTDFEAGVQSTRARAEVVAEAVQAAPNFKNFYVAPAAQPTSVSRADVRSEAVTAARAGKIAIGNFS